MADAIAAVREAVRDLGAGAFTMPPRLAFGGGRVLVMSAYHTTTSSAVVKTLSVELDRTPAILGTVVLAGPSGQVAADASAVTTLRTGAIVGVATDVLADRGASRLAQIGAGAQAADQVRAVHAVRPLASVTVFNRSPARAEQLLDTLSAELPGVELLVAATAEEAVGDAHIVNCATSADTPLFPIEALPERVHVNAIGSYRPSMRELPEALIATGLVVVDQLEAALEEAGEIVHALDAGALRRDQLVELADVLHDPPALTGRTVFKSVGLAVQDWAILDLLQR